MKGQLPRLLKSTAIYGSGQILTRAISFFLLPVFTAYLTPVDYGIFGILAMVSFFLVPIFSLGIGTSLGICYFSHSKPDTKEATIWTAFILLLISALLLFAIGFFFDKGFSRLAFQTDKYAYLLFLTMVSTSFGVLVTPFMLYLQFEEMALKFVVIASVATLISISINVLMVVGLMRGIVGLVEGSLIGQIVTFGLFAFYPVKQIRFRVDRAVSRDLLRHGLPMVPSFASLFVLQQGSRYVLQWTHGLTAVGIFTVGYNIGMFMNVLVNAFQSAWVPFFLSFSEKKEEARRLFGPLTTYYLLGFGSLCLLFYIFAKPLVMSMTAAPFHDAYKAIGLTAASQFFIGIFSLLLPPVYFAKNVKIVSLVQLISAGLCMAVALIVIPGSGLLGAALTLMLGMIFMCGIQYLWIICQRDRYLQIVYEGKRMAGIGFLYALLALLMLTERRFDLTAEIIISLCATGLLGILVYISLQKAEKKEFKVFLQSVFSQNSR